MSARVVAVANQKGGVGKTTTAVNLAACLAEAGERCLLVDLDPQANATSGLGTPRERPLDARPPRRRRRSRELATPSSFANLDLVPAKAELAAATVHLSALEGGERYLADALAGEATEPYGFVFLDCPPSFGPAHRQRACRSRPRARPRPGGVLRARRALAAPRLDRPGQAAAQPAARRSPGSS